MADFWSAPSFAFLTNFQGSSRESLPELLSPCGESIPALIQLSCWCDRKKTPIRDRGRLENDPQWVSGFLICCSWMFPEQLRKQVRTCGFRRNSSKLDKATDMRDSVWQNTSGSFLVTLNSTSSETRVMYSSAITGLTVFCDWLFLLFSGISLETSANFLFFLSVAIFLKETLVS